MLASQRLVSIFFNFTEKNGTGRFNPNVERSMRLCRNKGLRRSLSFLRLEVWVDFRQLIFGDFSKTFDSRAVKIGI